MRTSPVVVSISTKDRTPLEPGFAGYNSPLLASGINGKDPRLTKYARELHPGWLRYPAGTRTNAFDWKTGQYRADWVDRSAGFFGDESRDGPVGTKYAGARLRFGNRRRSFGDNRHAAILGGSDFVVIAEASGGIGKTVRCLD